MNSLGRLARATAIGSSLVAVFGACGSASNPSTPLLVDAGPDGGSACTATAGTEAPLPEPRTHTPRWAFEPWISKDISDRDDTYAFVDGFRDRGIPVGAVVLDSPWETNYNTFEPNPSRYPDFDGLVRDMHERGVRVVLWTTQFVNESSFDLEVGGDRYPGAHPLFDEGLACGFYVNDGITEFWWKGRGASVDFFHGGARAWFHRMQDRVLDAGIDGWKLDFGESYIKTLPIRTAAGEKSLQEYSEEYYADFYRYGRQKRGDGFVTMVRPWDESYDHPGRFFARKEHAPVAWVGDNRRDFVGLIDALDHTFRSVKAGYVVVGSDVGGYLDRDDKNVTVEVPYDHDAFARWVGVGAMSPFMQLHGRANLAPWTVPIEPDAFVALYRYWATLHHELVPFFYSLAENAYAGGALPVEVLGDEASWPGDYRWVLGKAFLVAPILDASGVRDVKLPEGSRWIDWWDEASTPHEGGTTLTAYDATPLDKMPLFVREGAIVPAEVEGALTGLGTAASKGALSVLVVPGPIREAFVLHDEDGATTTLEAQRTSDDRVAIAIARASRPVVLRVRAELAPAAVSESGAPLTEHTDRTAFDASASGWFSEPSRKVVWIKLGAASRALSVEVTLGETSALKR